MRLRRYLVPRADRGEGLESTHLSRSRRVSRTAGAGHFDPFPQPRRNGRYPFRRYVRGPWSAVRPDDHALVPLELLPGDVGRVMILHVARWLGLRPMMLAARKTSNFN